MERKNGLCYFKIVRFFFSRIFNVWRESEFLIVFGAIFTHDMIRSSDHCIPKYKNSVGVKFLMVDHVVQTAVIEMLFTSYHIVCRT